MKESLTMSFVRSEKPYEKRIAILPEHMGAINCCNKLYFETGYGKDFYIKDEAYEKLGCHIVSREEALKKDIICDTKIGEASYLYGLKEHTKLVSWIHAGANPALRDTLLEKKHTCYAWEDFYEEGRHIFWRNNQIAGAGGVMNAMQYTGYFPYGKRAGIIGRGESAAGAFSMLTSLGADVQEYSRSQEALFIKELPLLDIVVIAVRWDTLRTDYLVSSENRKQMKSNAIIIDISDDEDGAVERSVSTTIKDPIYYLDDIMVYSVCNVPSIFYKSATEGISSAMAKYIDKLVEQRDDEVLEDSIIIKNGKIINKLLQKQQDEQQSPSLRVVTNKTI